MNRNIAFLSRNRWIEQHPTQDANGNAISPRFLLMKLLYQKNLLKRGEFNEARTFGKEEGLHETTAYRLMGDIDVPQTTIIDRLEEERRLQISPTINRGSYLFLQRPDQRALTLHDPQTIKKIYWKDKCFDFLQQNKPEIASQEAQKHHLSFDIINHFNRHQIYRRAIKELNYAMAKMVNTRENLGFDPVADIRSSVREAYKIFLALEEFNPTKAQKFAESRNFIVFDMGTRRVIRLTKSTQLDSVADQFSVPTLFNIAG